ncbi:protealysin inhibitor emfourin [Frankia gtarii]|uniref:protealysin inhibitor emfourin n=1 Tax=Frankia gtarii TaxID=2950102 RepID=UPI0021C176A0|nr:protealysin inhibitor emfourin [Frankia gtarii]
MVGEAGRVRVVLERSGGLLGRPVRRGLDSADLPESEAVRLRELARGAVAPADGPDRRAGGAVPRGGPVEGGRVRGADRFVYTLEVDYIPAVDQPGERAVRTFSEPVPEELGPLLALLRAAPLLPARGRDAPR